MKLYFDIGNTHIKVNFNHDGVEYYQGYNTSIDYTVDTFYQGLPDEIKNADITKVMITSVVPRQETVIVGMVKKYWSLIPEIIGFPIKTGIKIQATSPKRVGADIVALASFVASKTDNGIIVNLGTTTTIIPVTNSSMSGIVIAPDLMSSFETITNKASLIGDIKLLDDVEKLAIGKDTREAVSVGVIKGHVGSIKYLVEGIDKDAKVFISGGHARKLKKYLPEYEFIKEATIQGMKIIEKHNTMKNAKK